MSTYDNLGDALDPTPRPRRFSGPFAPEDPLKTVAEAVAWCERKGLDPAEVRLAHNYVLWDGMESDEQVARRVERAKAAQASHLEAIQKMHSEYVARGLYDSPARPTTPEEAAR